MKAMTAADLAATWAKVAADLGRLYDAVGRLRRLAETPGTAAAAAFDLDALTGLESKLWFACAEADDVCPAGATAGPH